MVQHHCEELRILCVFVTTNMTEWILLANAITRGKWVQFCPLNQKSLINGEVIWHC